MRQTLLRGRKSTTTIVGGSSQRGPRQWGLLRGVVRVGAAEWSHGSRACGCDPAQRVSSSLSRASEMKRSACVGSTDVAVLRGLDLMQRL